jgi:hypothetical protein
MPAGALATLPVPVPKGVTVKVCCACTAPAASNISNKTANCATEDEKHRFAQETIKPDFIMCP